jgi:hypothetical protein
MTAILDVHSFRLEEIKTKGMILNLTVHETQCFCPYFQWNPEIIRSFREYEFILVQVGDKPKQLETDKLYHIMLS